MDGEIRCPACLVRIVPIKTVERSPKTGKPWLITKCSRERCGFNIDIQEYANYNPKTGEFRRDVW